ncbi:TonB-dependent receptor domain-containing protein [Spirosoma pollinicola]|uniref:TonB-dependent receptor n=1 Tax=Spirosoma pollinicola TaxID=2057025 RepID=A0A2K8YSH3_9BACT|nr:TonB-dependent receptor [Spirosoma pollinicola]AUD00538.1 TonB-dependent receptor [Spirosoma pollinicola]
MRHYFTGFLFLLSTGFALAQTPGTPPATTSSTGLTEDSQTKGNAKIIGYVVDSTLTRAVEFANIALYNSLTNKLLDGTVADEKGKFSLPRIAPGQYRLLISFLGFTSKTIENVVIVKGQTKDMGAIRLSASTRTLGEVTVTGQKALLEEKVDRLVYNADLDLAAKGGDATDILKKVPMLSVDLAGNVSLQGNNNVRVLINNKPSSILAGNLADALKQIPADLIKTVEVITSPSAKYDAEGTGGIINIITKKNTLQGLHLDVDGGVGNRTSTLGLNGSFRQGKLGVNLNGNGRAIYNKASTELDQSTFINGTTVRTSQQADAFDHGMFGQYALGFDYDLAKNQSLTAGARFGIRNFNRDQHQTTTLFTDEITGSPSKRDVFSKDLSNSIDLTVDYLHTYKPQQEWSISTQYSQNNLTNNFDANLLDLAGSLTSRQRNLNFNTNKEFTFQTDYQMPLTKASSLEFGGKAIARQVSSQYQYQLAGVTPDFVTDDKRPAGSLNYDQTIGAAYLSYTLTTLNKITIKAGARYEYTDIRATVGDNKAIAIPSYGKLVPSVNLSKKISEKSTLKLAYNRRIQRPGIQQLNPNFNTANPQNITVGNPLLKPETTDKVELGYSTYIKKTYLNFTLYTRLNTDDIQQMSQRSDTLAGAVITSFQNIGKEYNYGSNLFATINITPKWSVNGNIDFMYRYISGYAPDLSGQSVLVTNTGLSIGGRLDTQAQLGHGWAIQGNFGTRGRRIQLQGYSSGFIQYSLGLRKEFVNKRGSVGLAAENFLTNGMVFNTVLNSVAFNQMYRQNIYNSSVRLTFSYKIGKLSVAPPKKSRSVRNDDVIE